MIFEKAILKTGFCGQKCIGCAISDGEIASKAIDLINILQENGFYHNLKYFSDQETTFQHEDNFYSFLEGIINNFSNCNGCSKTSGFPFCKIRLCAIEKGVEKCTDCEKYHTCNLIKNNDSFYFANIVAKEKI